ncbi:uncharacterized protein LOC129234150 [Uloborus diversus]|uniref:uncharacterized protein LOC129234150 n=1 Tax=Uloborus diversus TaxID=327109 RepID=UPI00240A77BA|nr:uncharacterized protein LOC129234150 [Uloborus diversus]
MDENNRVKPPLDPVISDIESVPQSLGKVNGKAKIMNTPTKSTETVQSLSQVLPQSEDATTDDACVSDEPFEREVKPMDIMTELCIDLEGKHRAPKVLIDTIVTKVQDLLEQDLFSEEMTSLDEAQLDNPPLALGKKENSRRMKLELPKLSNVLQPLLNGDILTKKDHSQLSSILKEELITFLNHEDLICNGSTLRWQYRDLGEALVEKYPNMLWDVPSERQKKDRKEKAPIYAVFIRRLSQRRKMQRLRLKAKKQIAVNKPSMEAARESELSSEDAVSELKSVTEEAARSDANTSRIQELLKKSFDIRRNDDVSELPTFLLTQKCLETEVELRLANSMPEMEQKLMEALKNMSNEFSVPGTVWELEKIMQTKRATWSAVTMGDYSSDQKRPGPSLFFGSTKTLVIGHQMVHLDENCSLENACILLLGIYFILNLNFPSAFGQFLGVIQSIVVEKEKFPKQFSTNQLLQVTKKLCTNN